MRHRKAGRKLDRHSQERVALFRNLTMSLFERFGTNHEFVFTSIAKAKEVRGYAERIITLGIKARRELDAAAKAAGLASAEDLEKQHIEHQGAEGKKGKRYKEYPEEVRKRIAKAMHFRRLVLERLGCCVTPDPRRDSNFQNWESKPGQAVPPRHERAIRTLLSRIAPRFIKRAEEKPGSAGGYTRVLKTSKWVLGDGSTKALWGFVGTEKVVPAPGQPAEKKAAVGAK
ncbi:hypothetical protein HY251_08045 [bacterium]|nr:hypothetical protein [bacterium]